MYMNEYCVEDQKMSEDFLAIAKNKKYVVQCNTAIGWITVEQPEYRNDVSYRVIRKEEIK